MNELNFLAIAYLTCGIIAIPFIFVMVYKIVLR